MDQRDRDDLLKLEADINEYLGKVLIGGLPPAVEEFTARLHEIAVR